MNTRVGTRFIFFIVIVSSFITLLLTGSQIYLEYRQEHQKVEDSHEIIRRGYIQSLTESVWKFDQVQTSLILDGMTHLPSISRAWVIETGGETIERRPEYTYDEYQLVYIFKNEDHHIGRLLVETDYSIIYQSLKRQLVFILIGNALKTFLVSGFALFLFSRLVSHPLDRLAKMIKNSSYGEKIDAPDELEQIVDAFHDFQNKIDESVSKLAASNDRYRSLIENIPLKIFQKDLNGRFVAGNKAFLEEVNLSIEELNGKRDGDIVDEKHAAIYREDDLKVIRTGTVHRFEDVYETPEGKIRKFDTVKAPVYDNDGKIVGIVAIYSEVGELEEAKRELEESRTHLENMTILLKDEYFFYELSEERELIHVTRSVCEVLKDDDYTKVQRELRVFLTSPKVEAIRKRLISSGGKAFFEWEREEEQERLHYYDFIEVYRPPEGSRPARLVGLAVESTQRKMLERKMYQAQKMQTLGTLSGGIAHDFNNILTIILLSTEYALEKTIENAEAQEALRKIESATLRGQDLVGQILTFARREEGFDGGTKRDSGCDPIEVTKEVLELIESSLPSHIKLYVNLDSDLGHIALGPTYFHQVLSNLCTNAVLSLKEGERGEITLGLKKTKYLGHLFIELTVKDNGIGIAREDLGKIFDPYYSTRPSGDGSGLGLSIVDGIIARAGGYIFVESELGEGACFRVLIPTYDQVELEGGLHEVNETKVSLKGQGRILLVDDELMLLKITAEVLEEHGYSVTCYSTPMEALDDFMNRPNFYDLVMTDKSMPDLDGLRFIEAIRQHNSTIPIILYSGYLGQEDERAIEEFSVSQVLSKPLRSRDILLAIQEALSS